jgi:site-specific DNA recombinase
MSVNACIYARLSRAPDGSTEKVERQEADAREVAARLGWDVARVYADPSKSAWRRDVRRPAWEAMLADLNAGAFDGVIVYHGDRLIRQPTDLETLLRISDERHLQLASVSGTRDLQNPDDRFVLRIEAAQACRESDNISRRTRRGKLAAAKAGRTNGQRAFGWTPAGEIEPEEAELVRAIAGQVLAGTSLHSIVTDLQRRGVATTRDGMWRVTTLKQLLAHPRLAGFTVHRGEIVGRSDRPAILDEDTWRAVTAVINQRARGRTGPRDGKWLLSGIARCGSCDGPMYAQEVHGVLKYVCRNPCPGPKVARSAADLHQYVTAAVLAQLAGVDPAAPDDGMTAVREKLAGLESRRAELEGELLEAGGRSAALLMRLITELEARSAALRAQLAAEPHRPRHLAAGMTREEWQALPVDRQRSIVRDMVTVTVLPTRPGRRGFDPSAVRVVRRRR